MAVGVSLTIHDWYYSYCNSDNVNSEIASLNFVKMIPTEEMDNIKPDQRLVWSREGSCRNINIAPRLYKRKLHCIHNHSLPLATSDLASYT